VAGWLGRFICHLSDEAAPHLVLLFFFSSKSDLVLKIPGVPVVFADITFLRSNRILSNVLKSLP